MCSFVSFGDPGFPSVCLRVTVPCMFYHFSASMKQNARRSIEGVARLSNETSFVVWIVLENRARGRQQAKNIHGQGPGVGPSGRQGPENKMM